MLYDVWLFYWLLLLSSFLVWLNHFWVIDQLYLITIYESRSVILGLLPVALMGLKCLICSWWCHVVTCFDLTILESSTSIYFGILYGCLLRTIGYCDLSVMPSVANRELLWSLWLLFDAYQFLVENWCDYCGLYLWCFSVACIGLRWFCDLWFHEFRVGYLYVVARSGLQWGPGP